MHAFLTGSRVYGSPRQDSDIDLAVFIPEPDFSQLKRELGFSLTECGADGQQYPEGSAVFRCGKLNLLAFKNELEFKAWKQATDELKTRKPVSREQAAALIEDHCNTLAGGGTW